MEKRNRIVYALLLIASIVFIFLYGGRLPYTLFYLSVTLPALSFLYLLVVYVRFKYTKDFGNKTVTKGDIIDFAITVENEDFFLYPYLSLKLLCSDTLFAHHTDTKYFSLLPKTKSQFTYKVECRYRGLYELGVDSIGVWDLLCILRLKYRPVEKGYIIVYPRIIVLERFDLAPKISDNDESSDEFFGKTLENNIISDIRKYSYGDPLNRVHWKLTAKTSALHVKHYFNAALSDSAIILDTQSLPLPLSETVAIEDKLIEIATALVYYCLSKQIPIIMHYHEQTPGEPAPTPRSITARNLEQFQPLYKILATTPFSPEHNLTPIFQHYLSNNVEKSNMLVVSYNITPELFENLAAAAQAGFNVILAALDIGQAEFSSITDNLKANNVRVYHIKPDDDIKLALAV